MNDLMQIGLALESREAAEGKIQPPQAAAAAPATGAGVVPRNAPLAAGG